MVKVCLIVYIQLVTAIKGVPNQSQGISKGMSRCPCPNLATVEFGHLNGIYGGRISTVSPPVTGDMPLDCRFKVKIQGGERGDDKKGKYQQEHILRQRAARPDRRRLRNIHGQ